MDDLEAARLQVWEIYLSVQGESTHAGLPCTFVRLTGCPLRCTYCDTEYAFFGGEKMSVTEVIERVERIGCRLVEVTGGEPLAQPNCVTLLQEFLNRGYRVMLETSGAYPIAAVPREVRKIVDLKCPSSGEERRNLYDNIAHLAPWDEIKFVMENRLDYEWSAAKVEQFQLTRKCNAVLFSCVFGKLEPAQLVEWMLADKLYDVRMQLQAHKFIWSPTARGV